MQGGGARAILGWWSERTPRAATTGTVTFLFSDVERSTALLEKLGADEYARELELHRRELRRT